MQLKQKWCGGNFVYPVSQGCAAGATLAGLGQAHKGALWRWGPASMACLLRLPGHFDVMSIWLPSLATGSNPSRISSSF